MATATEQQQQHMARELRAQAAKFTAEMLQAVNAERSSQGLAPFCTNKKLQAAAQLHSEDQAKNNFMSHTGSDGSDMSKRITAQGFKWNGIAENVAAGQKDVALVVKSWMGSSGHRANILGNSKFFGMGYAFSDSSTYKHYWTQNFGSGNGEVCDSGAADTPPASTPAPATRTPATQAPATEAPVTQAPPVYTPRPTRAPIDQRPTRAPRPTSTQPSVTPSKPTVTPAPSVTPKPRGSRAPKKTDCKPIY